MRTTARYTLRLLLLSGGIVSVAYAGRPPLFEPAGIESCDGSSWSGITFGRTLKQDLTKQYRTSDRDTRWPTTLRLVRPEEDNTSYLVLLTKSGKNMIATGVVITYAAGDLTSGQLAEKLSEQPAALYPPVRNDDSRLEAYQERGVIALMNGESSAGSVLAVLLTRPAFLTPCLTSFSREPTTVVPISDPHAGELRIASFGSATATFNLQNATMKDGEKEKLEASMRSMTAGGKMRYTAGVQGNLTCTVDIQWDCKRGGTVGVTFALDGVSPYGPVHAEGSSFKILPKSDRAIMDNASLWYSMALVEAMDRLGSTLDLALSLQGPETALQARERRWSEFITQVRQTAASMVAAETVD